MPGCRGILRNAGLPGDTAECRVAGGYCGMPGCRGILRNAGLPGDTAECRVAGYRNLSNQLYDNSTRGKSNLSKVDLWHHQAGKLTGIPFSNQLGPTQFDMQGCDLNYFSDASFSEATVSPSTPKPRFNFWRRHLVSTFGGAIWCQLLEGPCGVKAGDICFWV